jgi:hypothetical protein
MPRKQKNPQKIAEGLAQGLTQVKAVEEAGYSPMTAQEGLRHRQTTRGADGPHRGAGAPRHDV